MWGDVAEWVQAYESYCRSILSTAALGATAFAMNGDMQLRAVIAPMVIAAIQHLPLAHRHLSGSYTKEDIHEGSAPFPGIRYQCRCRSYRRGYLYYIISPGYGDWLGLSFSVISGLVAGVIIGQATEVFCFAELPTNPRLPRHQRRVLPR